MIKAALAYTKTNGNRPPLAIFPLAARTKVPAISKEKGGNGCKDATTDSKQIMEWWTKYPHANIGLATGEANGLIVIDVDIKHHEGKYGDESLAELEEKYGELPHTWEGISGGGGRHLYFRYPVGYDIRNSESDIAPNIDVRANGGYIVAPPSVHESGNCYEWELSSIPNETELAELPPRWVELLAKKSVNQTEGKEHFALPDMVTVGKRNDTMFRFAASMRSQAIPPTKIMERMKAVNKERFSPMLRDAELGTIFDSVMRYPEGESYEMEAEPTEQDGKPKKERKNKPLLTVADLEKWLESNGIKIAYNCIAHSIEVDGVDPIYNPETVKTELHIIIHDQLKKRYMCDRGLVADLLGVIAGKHRYNPVTVMLDNSPPWDGVDRLPILYNILGISEDDTLSQTLVHKWLWQCISMANNRIDHAYGADGLLVLQGKQGCGKTSFVRKIAVLPELVKLGQYLDSRDKDTIRRCTSCWICEWGEIETTLRSDLERLKAFITAEIDEYRLPYGRTDQTLCRRTSLIATCNTERFLIDPTGSRRFWTVPVGAIDLDGLDNLNILQLWKQIELEAFTGPQGFRLTKQEQDQLAKRNTEHEKPLKAQSEIEDILAKAEADASTYIFAFSTVTDFKAEHDCLRPYSVEQIGKALDRLGITAERKTLAGKQQRVRVLPRYKWAVDGKNGLKKVQQSTA